MFVPLSAQSQIERVQFEFKSNFEAKARASFQHFPTHTPIRSFSPWIHPEIQPKFAYIEFTPPPLSERLGYVNFTALLNYQPTFSYCKEHANMPILPCAGTSAPLPQVFGFDGTQEAKRTYPQVPKTTQQRWK